MLKNVAVILSGGVGSRLKSESSLPKQYLKIAGKSILEHSVTAFQNHRDIDEIAIVANPMYHELICSMIEKNKFDKVKRVLVSGEHRYNSSLSAIKAYKELYKECNLIFHDAVRPLIGTDVISSCVKALKSYTAVDVAIPATDTIISVNSKGDTIKFIPNRAELMYGQTPQCFRLSVIDEAYTNALADPNFKVTDDCGVVAKYLPSHNIHIVLGSTSNIKITYAEDIAYANVLFQSKMI